MRPSFPLDCGDEQQKRKGKEGRIGHRSTAGMLSYMAFGGMKSHSTPLATARCHRGRGHDRRLFPAHIEFEFPEAHFVFEEVGIEELGYFREDVGVSAGQAPQVIPVEVDQFDRNIL